MLLNSALALRRLRARSRVGVWGGAALAIAACTDPQTSRVGVRRSDRIESSRTILEPVSPSATPTLLDNYLQRPPQTREQWEAEAKTWVLPQKTKRLDAVLFIGIAQADLGAVETVLAPHATWGLPDLRRLNERPIFDGDGGEAFMRAFQEATQRFPPKPESLPSTVPDGIANTFATGAEPMWTLLRSKREDSTDDFIVIRKVVYRGRPVIDYVGFWYDGPPTTDPNYSPALGAPPPAKPPMDRSAIPPELLGGAPPPG